MTAEERKPYIGDPMKELKARQLRNYRILMRIAIVVCMAAIAYYIFA